MELKAWLILFLPFIAAAITFFVLIPFQRKTGSSELYAEVSSTTVTATLFITFILSGLLLLKGASHHTVESSITWIQFSDFKIEFGILINKLSVLMSLIVTGIATLVSLYSSNYMKGEEGYPRYFAALSLFTFSMLGIVFSNNFIQIFIFWELVGLSSYLLIGFWYQKPSANDASKKAFLTTRVGDVGMMIGILLLFGYLAASHHGTFNFLEIEEHLHHLKISEGILAAACICIFLGAVGKSAQVPLHIWLPDAMEGPTPASALIHAATMVAAGVFMVARVFFLFEHSEMALQFITWTGALTAFIAASIAVVQNDMKKVLAYSTLSQLGYMVLALGSHSSEAAMFHLTTHAFFKALLFLCAGSFIHAMHTQDIWEMSKIIHTEKKKGKGLLKLMPITGATFLIGTVALMGIPPTSGFFSKEEVLYAAKYGAKIPFLLGMAVVFLTSFYMSRVVTVVYFSGANHNGSASHHAPHEEGWKITFPLIILAIFSLIAGLGPFKEFILYGGHGGDHGGHHNALGLMISSISLALLGAATGYFLYRNKSEEKHLASLKPLVKVFENKYYFDHFYEALIKNVQERIAQFADFFERVFVVESGVNGTARFTRKIGDFLRQMQTGQLHNYAFIFAAGLILMIILFFAGQVFMGSRLV